MKTLPTLILSCFIAACAHAGWRGNQAFVLNDSDLGMIAGNAVALIERYGAITRFAVSPDMDPRAMVALKRFPPLVFSAHTVRDDGVRIVPAGTSWSKRFRLTSKASRRSRAISGRPAARPAAARTFPFHTPCAETIGTTRH